MQGWLKWLIFGILAVWIGYYRHWVSQIPRTRTAGSSRIIDSLANNTHAVEFLNQSSDDSYFEIEDIIYANGLCGDFRVPPLERPCTPPLHIHESQSEMFTLIQGQISYQLGDEIYSCDIHTCPKPIIVRPLVPHTFWMSDNKEDLVVRARIDKVSKSRGMRREFFENFYGVFRDQQASIFQIFVLFNDALTYPASLPFPLIKTMVKIGAVIGRLLGYQGEYEEYTTITGASN